MKLGGLFGGLSLLGAVGFGYSSSSIRETVNPPVKMVGLEAHDSHAAASLLGQFRSSASSWLFLHADLYLHNGVEMRPLTDAELKSGKVGVGSNPNEQKIHDDSKIVTIVPSASEDFRGIFGDVERQIASYKDMKGHSHNNPTSSLPLFRLMTALDPQFVKGWTTAGFIMLWDNRKDGLPKTIAFLKEGLAANPKSIDIITQIAYCYLKEHDGKRDYAAAWPYLVQARNVGVENLEHLSDQEKEALLLNYRRLCVAARELKMFDQEQKALEEGLKVFPDDKPLLKLKAELPQAR